MIGWRHHVRGRITLGGVTDPYVPIVPGGPAPTLSQMMPVPAQPKSRSWVKPGLIALALALIAAAVGVTVWLTGGPTALEQAATKCEAGELGDGGDSLFLDAIGTAPNSGTVATSDLACVLDALHTPNYVIKAMEQTTALNGRQSQEWGDLSASWTYHPENGLDIIIRLK